ncbi:transcriptional activator FtrA [compost metagenome]
MHNQVLTSWTHNTSKNAEFVLSICTGALLLAKANLLSGLKITTNQRAMDLLAQVAPKIVRSYMMFDMLITVRS